MDPIGRTIRRTLCEWARSIEEAELSVEQRADFLRIQKPARDASLYVADSLKHLRKRNQSRTRAQADFTNGQSKLEGTAAKIAETRCCW
mgnify:CR=1 FL=1